MNFVDIITNNWQLAVTAILALIAIVFSGKRLAYFKWANETLFFAWAQAEKQGILEDWKGHEKFEHYLKIWQQKYREKYGTAPKLADNQRATLKAMELSTNEKIFRLSDPTSPDPE